MGKTTQPVEEKPSGEGQASSLLEEDTSRPTSAEPGMEENGGFITGAKLMAAMMGVSIVMLIAMIDLSIITTVRISTSACLAVVAVLICDRVLLTLR